MRKLQLLLNWRMLLLAGLLIGIAGCERLPLDMLRDSGKDTKTPRKLISEFGLRINDQTGEIRVFSGGRELPISKNGTPGSPVIANTIINSDFVLAQIRYTPLGCDGFDTVDGKNLRTIALDFRNISATTYTYVVPTNITGSNLFGVGGSVATNIAPSSGPSDVFTISIQAALASCATYSFFFDLSDGFTD